MLVTSVSTSSRDAGTTFYALRRTHLQPDHPGAATLLYRRLVTGVVDRAASKYYPYAARDYHAAAALADVITNNVLVLSHADWIGELRHQHGRKSGF